MIPKTRLRDFIADRRRPLVSDLRSRYQQFRSHYQVTTPDVSGGIGDHEILTNEAVRIRSVQISDTITGGTVSMDLLAEGRSVFDGTNFPTSGSPPQDAFFRYPLHPDTTLTLTLAGTTGVPAGIMNIVVNAEPIETLPQTDDITLVGADRLQVSRRNETLDRDAIRRSTLGIAADQTEAGRAQLEQIRTRVGRNARSLHYPNRFAFRGGQRAR